MASKRLTLYWESRTVSTTWYNSNSASAYELSTYVSIFKVLDIDGDFIEYIYSSFPILSNES